MTLPLSPPTDARPRLPRASAVAAVAATTVAALMLAGCSASALLADVPDAQKAPRTVAIKLHAANKLNTNARGQSLALVTRVYKLRQRAAFDQAPFDTFLSPQKEQAAFGADLLEVKEFMLIPGQHVELAEKVSREAGFIGVVGLFNNAAPQRWRASIPAAEAEKRGLMIAASACTISVSADAPAPGASTLKAAQAVQAAPVRGVCP